MRFPVLPPAFRLASLAAAITLGVAALTPGFADTSPGDPRVADIEKQIAELQKKLAELKKADAPPATDGGLPQSWAAAVKWRSIGPATMGGRVTALSVCDSDPSTWWIATASGGLLKTDNNGTTFTHQFDKEATVSVGDVCVAPSDKNIVWVGTGENNPRNSVSYGDGVYKSTDGGKTWKHSGLRDTFQIGKIIVHPKNPDIVYVGALGRLYGSNSDRGLFKTTDGGKTWSKILYHDENTGVIDMRMHPSEPDTLLVAMWERRRDEFDSFAGPDVPDGIDNYDPAVKFGPHAGIYRTTDGGKTFTKLTNGLPTVKMGRIGLDWCLKQPNIVYAIIDTEKFGTGNPPPPQPYMGIVGEDTDGGAKLTQIVRGSPAEKAGVKENDVVVEMDGKKIEGYGDLIGKVQEKKVGDAIKLKVKRGSDTVDATATLAARPEGGGPGGMFANLFGGRAPLTPGFRGDDVEGGINVAQVPPESGGAKAGLKPGDLLLEVDGKPVTTFRDLMTRLTRDKKAGDTVKAKFRRGDETFVKELTLETLADRRTGGGRLRPYAAMLAGQRENVQNQQGKDGYQSGGVYKSTDGGETWSRVNSVNPRPMYFSQVRVDPSDEKKVYVLGITMYASTDGGKTFKTYGNNGVHADQHALWINPRDGRHMILGTDGGCYVTYDRMNHWDHHAHMSMGQFYHVAVDSKRPYNVYGGMQDNGTWGGPSRTLRGSGATNDDWIVVGGGDGFMCRVDKDDPDLIYATSQDGNVYRRNLRTGAGGSIRAKPIAGKPPIRYNWNTPFILSNANPKIVYVAGSYVFRSLNQGADLKPISPEITRTPGGSGTALAESPRNPDVLWAGTDDGNVWVTRDGGQKWANVSDKIGLPKPYWVSTIEASRFAPGRAYVCFDAHRSDDDKPYVFVTEDYGQTWKNITANLPAFGSTRCLREDVTNEKLLLCGTEFAAFASVDRGGSWTKFSNNLPTVAVHELAIHPTAGEVVAATHGRSLWVADITPLRQTTADVVKAPAHLFAPQTATRWRLEPAKGSMYGAGSKRFVGENPPAGAAIYFSLTKVPDKISLKVMDIAGKSVRDLTIAKEQKKPGLHRVGWDLTRISARTAMNVGEGRELPEEVIRRGASALFTAPVPAGVYRVVLTVDDKEYSQPIRVEADPMSRGDATADQDEGGDGSEDDDIIK